jgi:hypothetical protein
VDHLASTIIFSDLEAEAKFTLLEGIKQIRFNLLSTVQPFQDRNEELDETIHELVSYDAYIEEAEEETEETN